ncbi:MAG: cytochrome c oxidase assembly protein [Pseudomonadota bacterium]|nr:cytochrome c oxidase assembly protein [Pseudomonadota bacterium]
MPKSNLSLALNLAALVLGMLLLAYASVPLYRIFCAATGFGGTPVTASHAPGRTLDRVITVDFNADTDPALPWQFAPEEKSVRVRVGQQTLAFFNAYNRSDKPITGRAVYNILPLAAGGYFVKIECFCFKEQTLAPGQRVDMPVSFYIDPSIMADPNMNDLKTITLSYTFFSVKTGR